MAAFGYKHESKYVKIMNIHILMVIVIVIIIISIIIITLCILQGAHLNR